MPKSAKFQSNGKNDPPSGPCASPGGTIFLSKILILVSSISLVDISLVKKAKWVFDEKIFNFSK